MTAHYRASSGHRQKTSRILSPDARVLTRQQIGWEFGDVPIQPRRGARKGAILAAKNRATSRLKTREAIGGRRLL